MRNSAYTPRSVAQKASQTPRTIIALLIAMLLPLGAWALGGSGTSASPYTIASATDLKEFADIVNGTNGKTRNVAACGKLTADITLTSAWTAMGSSSYAYTGTFDGQGHTISGLNLTAKTANAGLFGYVNGATIKNFTLAGTISSGYENTGSVVGTANGATKIYNVYSSVNITMTAAKNHIGGIAGQILQVDNKTGEIKGCAYSGTMNLGSSTDSNGGIVGYCELNANIEIENCFFSGSISSSGSNPRIGGILGYADDDGSTQNFKYIRNCFCDGTLSPSTGDYVGIFAGYPRGKVKDVISNNTYVSTASTNMAGNSTQTTAANNGCKKITISVKANANGKVSQTYVNPTSTTATQLQVVATPDAHYHLNKWSDNNTNASRNLALTNNIDLSASFAIDQHTISVATNNANYGTVSGGGTYNYGTQQTITATPKTGYDFVQWNDGVKTASRTITVSGNATYTAIFAAHTYGSPVWTWASDGKSASAKITCTACSNEISGSATITSKVKIAATCDVKGTTTYTAKVTLNGTERTATKDVQDIAALGHTYDSPVWTWADDGKSASATVTCTRDANHKLKGNAAITSVVKTAATCTAMGTTTYTAKVTLNGTECTATKDVQDIAALEHQLDENDHCSLCGGQKTAKAYLKGSVLTFCYDMTEYSNQYKLNTGNDSPNWWYSSLKKSIETVVFDPSFDVVRPTTCYRWFCDFNNLKSIIGIEYLHTNDVEYMHYMFSRCSSLTSLDVSHFNTAKVTNMECMFNYCSGLTSLDFSSFNTEEVTNMNSMFSDCSDLTSLDLSSFNTEEVTNMNSMFSHCSDLTSLNLSNFNTAKVTNMPYMFEYCSLLQSLTINNFSMSSATSYTAMFNNCTSLDTLTLKSIPYLQNGTFNTQFRGAGKTVNLFLDENSEICDGTTYLPTITNCNHYHSTPAHQDATCTENGFDGTMCKYCKSELEMTTIPAPGHSFSAEYTIDVAATCTADGRKSKHCENCDATTDVQSIPAPGHSFSAEYTIDVAATCTGDGSKHRYCSVCSARDVQPIPALGHSMTAHAAVAATCTTPGNEAYWTCSHDCCHDKHFKDGEGSAEWGAELFIAALGHDMTSHDYVAATCTTGGNEVYYTCSRDCCEGMNFKANDGMEKWGAELYTAALGHDFSNDYYIVVERICTPATCISQASYYYSCSRCYESEHDADHTFTAGRNGAHQIADDGTCSVCHNDFNESKVVFADGTLTFYHDAKEHTGDTYLLTRTSDWRSHNSEVTTVVFDPSFAAARPTSCKNWFSLFVNLSQITGIENLNTSEVTDMGYMFNGCQNLSSLDLSHFNTEKVTDMSNMFNGCQNLSSLDLSNFNTEKVTDMSLMFSQCQKLASLDISNFNTSEVTSMSFMFYECQNLTSLDLSSFNTSAVTGMSYMFNYCDQLQSLTIGNFDMQKVTNCTSMLIGSYNLKTLTLKSLPFLQDGTFNTRFDGKTVNLVLDENSVIYKGTNYLPAFTSCNHYNPTPVHVDVTCTVDGYDAKHCSYCQLEFDKTNVQSALGHDYDYSFEWSDDYTQCMLVLTCRHDNSHSDRIVATVESNVEKPATCTTKGTTRYTAQASVLGHINADYKVVDDIPALGHLLGDDCEVLRESTCAAAGLAHGHCTRCNEEVDAELPKGDHTFAFEDVNHDECTVCGHTLMHFFWSKKSPAVSINTNGEFYDNKNQKLNYTIVIDKEKKEGYIDFEGELSKIGEDAFSIGGWVLLLTIPGSVTEIGEESFRTSNINNVDYRMKSMPHIDQYAFNFGINFYVPAKYYSELSDPDYLEGWHNFYVAYCDLTDDAPTVYPTEYSEGALTYTRGTSAPAKDSYATFCLPFTIALEHSSCIEAAYVPLQVAFYDESTGMLNLFFREIKDYVPAGMPFVARMTGQDIKLFNSYIMWSGELEDPQNTDLSVYNYTGTQGVMFDNTSMSLTFGGTYEKFFDSNLNTFNTNGSFGRSDYVSPFRSYVQINTGDDRVKGFNAFFVGGDDDVEDCIEKIEAGTATPDAFYNLGGMRISKPINGLYIHNGKKYIKK